jgi:hypothetical protein
MYAYEGEANGSTGVFNTEFSKVVVTLSLVCFVLCTVYALTGLLWDIMEPEAGGIKDILEEKLSYSIDKDRSILHTWRYSQLVMQVGPPLLRVGNYPCPCQLWRQQWDPCKMTN